VSSAEGKLSRLIVSVLDEPPRLTVVAERWQAWWKDADPWDGYLAYDNLDAAMRHTLAFYLRDEYAWDLDDNHDDAPEGEFSWEFEYGRWHLLDGGMRTGVQLYKSPVYGRKGE
jgi:hypothetical protein